MKEQEELWKKELEEEIAKVKKPTICWGLDNIV